MGMRLFINLEHIVGGAMVRPEELKVEVIRQFSRSWAKKDFRIFLGLSGYFIQGYSAVAGSFDGTHEKE